MTDDGPYTRADRRALVEEGHTCYKVYGLETVAQRDALDAPWSASGYAFLSDPRAIIWVEVPSGYLYIRYAKPGVMSIEVNCHDTVQLMLFLCVMLLGHCCEGCIVQAIPDAG